MVWIASSRPGAWLFSKMLHHVDRVLFRATGGRLTVPTMAGLPVVFASTSGARTGEERTVPLLGIPFGDDLALIGSNWGGRRHLAWVYNLTAHPSATVTCGNRTVPVTARRAEEDETEQVFDAAAQIYPGYTAYRSRAGHRQIRVFILRPQLEG